MTGRRINVLAVVTAMETGGLEAYLIDILHAIDRETFKVTIVCTGRDSNWYSDELDAMGVRTLFCPNPYSQIGYVYRVARLMRDFAIDVACDFRSDFAAPTMLAARYLGIRSRIAMYRSTSRLFRPTRLRNAYAALLHWGTRRWATRIIGNARCVLDAFYPGWASSDRFVIAYNGVDLNRFSAEGEGSEIRRELGIDGQAVVVGHVGRFRMAKNHSIVLKTFARLKSRIEGAHLLLVGDGDLRPAIETMIMELNLSGSVTLAGWRSDIDRVLSAMDVYVFPSIYEGHPNALMEAMASGLPVVASNIPPILETMPPDYVDDLCAPDDVAGMTRRLERYCRDAECRKAAGARLRQHVGDHFSLDAAAKKLCEQWVENL